MKVVFTTQLPERGFSRLKNELLYFPKAPYISTEELKKELADADVLVATFDFKVTDEILSWGKGLKLVANFGVGFNNIDLDYCKSNGITVTNTPLPVIEPTAEHAFALMHTIAHRTAELDRKLRMPNNDITFGVMNNLGVSLFGKTLGIIGMGNIGQAIARRAIACGMNIVYHNRHRLAEEIEQKYNAKYISFDELLQTADFVSLNLPYTPAVKHIISAKELAMMKPTAILINTARGAHIDEAALVEALQNGIIAGAALDVYENEPNISQGLKELDNVVLSPHIGTGTIDGRISMCENVSDNIIYFENNQINKLNKVI